MSIHQQLIHQQHQQMPANNNNNKLHNQLLNSTHHQHETHHHTHHQETTLETLIAPLSTDEYNTFTHLNQHHQTYSCVTIHQQHQQIPANNNNKQNPQVYLYTSEHSTTTNYTTKYKTQHATTTKLTTIRITKKQL